MKRKEIIGIINIRIEYIDSLKSYIETEDEPDEQIIARLTSRLCTYQSVLKLLKEGKE
tara:strand:- start:593 stop:766 length:174 start_codon:yes stop_codon:yes gene_type:complete